MSDFPAVRFLDRRTPPHLFTLIIITGVSVLSMNIFLPSLPGMAAYFGTPYSVIQLTVPIYLAVNACMQLLVGPLSDRFGRRPVVLTGFAIFALASLGCALSQTVELFLVFRFIQASVVVGMVLGRAIVRDMVDDAQAASMIGYVTMFMAIVPMIGPSIGGVLDKAFGWQASFLLLFALGFAVLTLLWADLGETARARSASFADQFRAYPGLLRARRFWGYCLTAAFGSGAFFAYLGGAPFIGSELFGLDQVTLGFYFGAPAGGYLVGNFIAGRFSVRIGINMMILWGCIISTAGMVLLLVLFLVGLGSAELFFLMMTILGLGNGMMMPNANAGMLSVRPKLAGSASGLGGAILLGTGAALSAYAGFLLTEESGAYPLLVIQALVCVMSLVAILYVIRRERVVAAD